MREMMKTIWFPGFILCMVIIALLMAVQNVFAAKILIIHSYGNSYGWTRTINDSMLQELEADSMTHDIFIEYLDCKSFSPDVILPEIKKLMYLKYSVKDKRPDIVLMSDNIALEFFKKERHDLFRGIPGVFCGINNYTEGMIAGYGLITGVAEETDVKGTIELMMKLQPDLTDVAVINDNTETGIAVRDRIFSELNKKTIPFRVHDLIGLSATELAEIFKKFPTTSAVLYGTFFVDKTGRRFSGYEAISNVLNATDLMVYVHADNQLYYGACAGSVVSAWMQGHIAGKMAREIISGKSADLIPVMTTSPNEVIINYPAFIKRGGNPSRIPSGSRVINKPVTLWSEYGFFVMLTCAVFVLMGTMIIILVIQVKIRKLSQVKVEQGRLLLQKVIENIPSMVVWCNSEGYLCGFNKAFSSFVSCSEIIGKRIEEIPFPEPLNRHLLQELEKVRHDGDAVLWEEIRIMPGPGENSIYLYSIIPLKDYGLYGKMGILILLRDITDKKILEEQLYQSRKMEAVGRLAGGIAHDFNNLLAGIMGSASLILFEPQLSDDLRSKVNIILQSSEKAKNLIKQLLDFSRKREIVFKPVNLNSIIYNSSIILRQTIQPDVVIKCSFGEKESIVSGDESQLQSVILNLGLNARDSMCEGGELKYVLTEEMLDSERLDILRLKGLTPGRYAMLEVSDTGCGIPQEYLPNIFEPFFSTKGEKGTGLGLATTYSFIKSMNGEITVESSPGHGTKFVIYLAVIDNCEFSDHKNEYLELDSIAHGKILIVDDKPEVLNIVEMMLNRMGFSVIKAESGKIALELIRNLSLPPDIILLDMVMPEMNGVQVLTALKNMGIPSKVIISSGYNEEEFNHIEPEYRPDAFIDKPYSYYELYSLCKRLLR